MSLRTRFYTSPAVPEGDSLAVRAQMILSAAILLQIAHAFIPIEQFINRGDDAFYYFKVAANWPNLGYWSLDGIHDATGVQPLWAVLLTCVAQILAWLGVTDPHALARVFVALTAVCNFSAAMLLYRLLASMVSTATAIVATGAFLFPVVVVWPRVWGMENSLYALMLVATVSYFHGVFLKNQTTKTSVVFGLLLGLTALSRLNATLFVACALVYFVIKTGDGALRRRLRHAVIAGFMASALTLPYFVTNLVNTGHFLPISGVAKTVETQQFLKKNDVGNRLSLQFVKVLKWRYWNTCWRYIESRVESTLWFMGFDSLKASGAAQAALAIAIALIVLLLGNARNYLRYVRACISRLKPFTYILVFGVVDAIVSVFFYPTQLRYAMLQWWFVPQETIIIVLTSAIVGPSLGYVLCLLFPARLHVQLVSVFLIGVILLNGYHMGTRYWGPRVFHETWNDESYRASAWLNENVPENVLIGSWNAGVLAFYTSRTIVNLDGLMNDHEFLEYLFKDKVPQYIIKENIAYLADLNPQFDTARVRDRLRLTEVYSNPSRYPNLPYRIYRVDGLR